jgi:hypothetical protein
MHPRKSWFVVAALAAFAAQAAVIYKWTDADGVIHFSDQAVPGAEKVYTTNSTMGTVRSSAPRAGTAAQQQKSEPVAYSQLLITSPKSEETFFGDDAVSVQLSMVPSLQPNQTIIWHLNGQQLSDQTNQTSFTLPRLDRNAYTLAATVTDQTSGESQTSNNVTFYVRQPSALSPQHKN